MAADTGVPQRVAVTGQRGPTDITDQVHTARPAVARTMRPIQREVRPRPATEVGRRRAPVGTPTPETTAPRLTARTMRPDHTAGPSQQIMDIGRRPGAMEGMPTAIITAAPPSMVEPTIRQ